MMPKWLVLNIHYGKTNGKANVYSDKQIQVDMDKIVSFVIQSCQVSEAGVILVSHHVNYD